MVPNSVLTTPAVANSPCLWCPYLPEPDKPRIRRTGMIITKVAFTESCAVAIRLLTHIFHLKVISSGIFKL